MKRSVIETVLGAVVLFIAGFFLVFSYKAANVKKVTGYVLTADFTTIGGLNVGDEVKISGVKVGSIVKVDLTPEDYLARVHMSIDPSVQVKDDAFATISSESLLGGRYLALDPGYSDENLENGDRIVHTQAPQNLEELLGKFIFSAQDSGSSGGDNHSSSGHGGDDYSAETAYEESL